MRSTNALLQLCSEGAIHLVMSEFIVVQFNSIQVSIQVSIQFSIFNSIFNSSFNFNIDDDDDSVKRI